MTFPRNTAIRIVASSLCFDQDPPPVRTLDKARTAAAGIVDALALAGMLDISPETGNGGHPDRVAAVDDGQEALPLT